MERIKKFMFERIGLPKFLKITELEDSLADKDNTLSFSSDSPTRFDIPLEFARQQGIDMPLRVKITPHILSCMKNIKKAILELKNNSQNPRKTIEEDELDELHTFIKSLNISGIGFTRVPREFIFEKKAVAYENAIVLAMNMDNEKISTAPSKKSLKNIWMTMTSSV